MDALPPAIFPDAVVGFQCEFSRLAPECLQKPKQSLVAEPRQTTIIKHRHRRENDTAVGIVLHLSGGGIADPHRPVAAVALERWCRLFVHRLDRDDAIDRSQRLVGIGCDPQDKRNEVLHRLGRTDPV